MGLIEKKDEKDYVDGVEVIGRGEGPDPSAQSDVKLEAGKSAEDIAKERSEEKPVKSESKPKAAPKKKVPGKDHGKKFKTYAVVGGVVIAIVAGCTGYFIGNGGFGGKGLAAPTMEEGQLDGTCATFTYNGKKQNLSARQVIEGQYGLDAVKTPDGKYPAPGSEAILSYVRNQILVSEAEAQGLGASDKDVTKYAKDQLGSDDFEAIAQQYGVEVEQAKKIVKDNATISNLYNKIVPTPKGEAMPQAPTEPADGNADAASKEYADYIVKLLGKEWDAQKGTWASKDGEFYKALGESKTFTKDSATYKDAQTAYYVAYQGFAKKAQDANKKWAEYCNGLYANADIDVYGLYV